MKNSSRAQKIRALTFQRCGIPFGVDVAQVREIRIFEDLRPLALAIHPLIGLVLYGDQILPVLDPHAFGSAQRRPVGRPLTTIVCEQGDVGFALVADAIADQVDVGATQIQRRANTDAVWLHGEVEAADKRKFLLLAANEIAHRLNGARAVEEGALQAV